MGSSSTSGGSLIALHFRQNGIKAAKKARMTTAIILFH
jgi:hypothetical protein